MKQSVLKILLIEDNPGDARLVVEMLGQRVDLSFELKHVLRLEEALNLLKAESFDAILLDMFLPDSRGLEGLDKIILQKNMPPVIVLTGNDDENLGVQAIQKQASDYLVKGRISSGGLVRCVLYSIERSRYEKELAKKTKELERSNNELVSFAHSVSHDLQEPLGLINLYCGVLAGRNKGRLDGESRESVDIIQGEARRMMSMIRGVLEYSLVGNVDRTFEFIDCSSAVRDAVLNLRELIAESGADLKIDPLPSVYGNKIQLVRLFQNLISNAIKYKGGNPPVVRIGAEKEKDAWIFKVADNGIGIAPEKHGHAFQLFQRFGNSSHVDGVGIGLAICKRIVEAHQGRIWLKSKPGKGTEFYFTIPADRF